MSAIKCMHFSDLHFDQFESADWSFLQEMEGLPKVNLLLFTGDLHNLEINKEGFYYRSWKS